MINRLLSYANEKIGLAYLPEDYLRFLKTHITFYFANNLCMTFINTFLFQTGSGFETVMLYNMTLLAFQMTVSAVVVTCAKYVRLTFFTRTGIALFACAAAVLVFLGEGAGKYFLVIAVFIGVGGGCYWIPHFIYTVSFTTPENHQRSLSAMGILSTVIVLLTPIVSGFFISYLPGLSGYMMMFALTIVAYVFAAVMSFKIPSRLSVENPLPELFKKFRSEPALWSLIVGELLNGVQNGAFLFYLNTMIYAMVENEFIIGLTLAGRSIITLVVYKLLSFKRFTKMRIALMIGMAFLGVMASAGFYAWFSFVYVIVYALVTAMTQTFVQNGLQYTSFDLCRYFSRDGTPRNFAVMALRSILLDLGRIIGILFMLRFPPVLESAVTILFTLSVISFPLVFFYRYCSIRSNRRLETENK